MKGRWADLWAALPGLAVAAAALGGWVPHARDLPAYFVPLRQHTARVLAGQASPFWLAEVGCGEPFFANPQSALLYPPAWLALVLPPEVAVGVEVGLHLALLGWGTARLARRLGATGWWALAAGWGAVAAGPVVNSAGVLNNLNALTWLPWAWEAGLAGGWRRCAAFSALAFVAGEPQLAALGGAVSVLLAPTRRTAAALLLAGGLSAVQAVPFAFWVAGGDRGEGMGADEAARGALALGRVPSLAFFGAGQAGPEFAFVTHPTLPAWALVGVALALGCAGPRRRVALAALVSAGVAVLAGTPAGGEVWTAATLGLVRYPARLLMPAAVLAAGSLALAGVHAPALELRRADSPRLPCAAPQRAARRMYLVEPSQAMFAWIAGEPGPRTAALGLGYQALRDGRRMARSFAPLVSQALATHLRQADQGPAGRWWLDALGADAVLSFRAIPGFPVLCQEDGVVLSANPTAWPLAAVVAAIPAPGEGLVPAGKVLRHQGEGGYHRWVVQVAGDGGVLLRLDAADGGWRYRVDGAPAYVQRGAGILRGVPVPPGEHVVEARYRPPGVGVGGMVTLMTLMAMAALGRRAAWRDGTDVATAAESGGLALGTRG